MSTRTLLSSGLAAFAAFLVGASALAATSIHIGDSGKTVASSVVECATNPSTGDLAPVVDAGLYQPKSNAKATVWLNGATVATVTAASPSTRVWLAEGANTVVVAISKKAADSYSFTVPASLCSTGYLGQNVQSRRPLGNRRERQVVCHGDTGLRVERGHRSGPAVRPPGGQR